MLAACARRIPPASLATYSVTRSVGPGAGGATGAVGGAPASGAVYPGRAATANANATLNLDNGTGFALGVLVGGLLALAGVALGARIGRGSHGLRGRL